MVLLTRALQIERERERERKRERERERESRLKYKKLILRLFKRVLQAKRLQKKTLFFVVIDTNSIFCSILFFHLDTIRRFRSKILME